MKSIVSEFGLGFALLLRDVLDGEFIERLLTTARTHRSFLYSEESTFDSVRMPVAASFQEISNVTVRFLTFGMGTPS
jgi:hypothetical protein